MIRSGSLQLKDEAVLYIKMNVSVAYETETSGLAIRRLDQLPIFYNGNGLHCLDLPNHGQGICPQLNILQPNSAGLSP